MSDAATAAYRRGRSKTWLKTKFFTESAFVVIGTDRDRKTGALRALLARTERQKLTCAGAEFIALSGDQRDHLLAQLETLTISRSPLLGLRMAGVQWAEPRLTVRVRHLAGSSRSIRTER
jgi:ATP-dependent DNA ligase